MPKKVAKKAGKKAVEAVVNKTIKPAKKFINKKKQK